MEKNNLTMNVMNLQEFEKLAQKHEPHCVSIYIPTHRVNEEGDAMQRDQIQLKNQVQEAEKQLTAFGMKESATAPYLRPITDLLEKTEFWLHNDQGLAIFLSKEGIEYHRAPASFTPYTYVGTHFYLKPLAPLIRDQQKHFILLLSLGEVALYEVTAQTVDKFQTGRKLPQELAEVVGYDYEESHLQQRTGHGERGEADGIYHGHGAGNESEKKEEILKYFRKIEDILTRDLNALKLPLLVACVDYLFPLYKEANTYPHLMDEHLSGNMEHEDLKDLAERSRALFRRKNEKELEHVKERFEEALSQGRAGYKAENTVPAALSGRVESLLLSRDTHIWGTYREKTHSVETTEVRKVGDSDLLDLAATHTVLNGGEVWLLPEEELPAPETESNAIFRYSETD
jgi:hypothetical protein